MKGFSAPPEPAIATDWRALRLFAVYRLVLAALLGGIFLFSQATVIGRLDPTLFLATILLYLLFGFATLAGSTLGRPPIRLQAPVHALGDVVAITLLLYASGGVQSGLGVLMIVSMVAGGVFLDRRGALAIASAAVLLVLAEELSHQMLGGAAGRAYTHAGLLGAAYFGAALLANLAAHRLRESEALAAQRGVDLANMAQLNEYIIQRIGSGILVVDANDRIRLMNETAWHMLRMPTRGGAHGLEKLSPELYQQLRLWRSEPGFEPHVFRMPASVSYIVPRFARLGQREDAGTLIYLEDSAVMTKKAQDLKLTSLGRLTASIAHEIRNPLGAISHAAQLLDESPNLDSSDRRLTRIVREQSARMNSIIENIMQLSRRDRAAPEALHLKPWLERFVDDFVRMEGVDRTEVEVAVEPSGTEIWMDPSQLHQVVFNLCQNGLRHGSKHPGSPKLKIRGGITKEFRGPFLEVIDFGPGIAPDVVPNIFEPFFTTETGGTGLGLYIARELCESNQAHLEYVPVPTGGSCFRIIFLEPEA